MCPSLINISHSICQLCRNISCLACTFTSFHLCLKFTMLLMAAPCCLELSPCCEGPWSWVWIPDSPDYDPWSTQLVLIFFHQVPKACGLHHFWLPGTISWCAVMRGVLGQHLLDIPPCINWYASFAMTISEASLPLAYYCFLCLMLGGKGDPCSWDA